MPDGFEIRVHLEASPKRPPEPEPCEEIKVFWTIGPVTPKDPNWVSQQPRPSWVPEERPDLQMQLTADQQVQLSVAGQDTYGNPVAIGGDTVWQSSDETILQVVADPNADPTRATAVAVGPAGTASVTCTNDENRDGTGDFIGSLAIDVVAGAIAEIQVAAGAPENKPAPTPPPPPTPTP